LKASQVEVEELKSMNFTLQERERESGKLKDKISKMTNEYKRVYFFKFVIILVIEFPENRISREELRGTCEEHRTDQEIKSRSSAYECHD